MAFVISYGPNSLFNTNSSIPTLIVGISYLAPSLPESVPLRLSLVVIERRPSPASVNMTRARHVLDTQSGVPYTPAHDADCSMMVHDGGERSGYYEIKKLLQLV